MNCFTHPQAAIGICKHCGRGLCHDCVVEVELSLACKSRCEAHVAALNELLDRGKTAYQKTAGAYTKIATVMGLTGLLFTVVGIMMRKADFIALLVFTPLGLVFLLCSVFFFHSAKQYRSRD